MVKDVKDDEIKRTSNVTDYVLGKWAEADPNAPLDEIKQARSRWRATLMPNPNNPQARVTDKYLQLRPDGRGTAGNKPVSEAIESPVAPIKSPTREKWVSPRHKATAAPVEAPPKPKAPPQQAPKGIPDPFRPPKPKHDPRPKNAVVTILAEAYDDEVHPGTASFWRDLPKNRQHIYAKHRIMAMHGDELSRKSFEFTRGRAEKAGGLDEEQVGRAFMRIMQLEANHQEQLESLAKRVITEVWGVPEEMLDGMITREVEFQPGEPEPPEARAQLDPKLLKLINKRITMNALIQGSAVHNMMTMHYIVDKEINRISPDLMKLYNIFTAGSHYGYWLLNIAEVAKMMAAGSIGSEKVDYSNGQPKIVARAIMFPILLQELSKGVAELISYHAFADLDAETTKKVFAHADAAEDEFYLIQVGPELWRRFLKVIPKDVSKAQVLAALAVQDPDKLDEIIAAIVENSEQATEMVRELVAQPEEFEAENL